MYEITVIDYDLGFILNENAERIYRDDDPYYPKFKTLEEAEEQKDKLLENHAHIGVIINNLEKEGKGEFYFNEYYVEELDAYYKWRFTLWRRLFQKKPKLKYYKPEL